MIIICGYQTSELGSLHSVQRKMADRYTIETLFYLKNPNLVNRDIAECVQHSTKKYDKYLKQIIQIAKKYWLMKQDNPYIINYGKAGCVELFTGVTLQDEFGEIQVILDEAVKLIEESAQKGNAWGMFQIGSIYMDGTNGVAVDHERGFSWLVRSAKTGCGFALQHLATYYLYNTGKGIIITFLFEKKIFLSIANN
jgi:TPR repeat protein